MKVLDEGRRIQRKVAHRARRWQAARLRRQPVAEVGGGVLTAQQMRSRIDAAATVALGISGDEFVRRLDAGTLPRTPSVEHIAMMVGGRR